MKNSNRVLLSVLTLSLLLALFACAIGKQLSTVPASQTGLNGMFTVYLYGCRFPADIKNAAFLINEGAKYPFKIFDLDTSYKIIRNVPAEQALRQAREFLLCSTHRVTGTSLKRISDTESGTFGYEIKPQYFAIEFGTPDVLTISYALHNGIVRAYIRYQPGVESAIENPGGDDSRDSSHN